jgi:aspartate aminotransferase
MPKINPRASARIKPSGTMALFNRVKQMRDSGADIISFTAGELDIDSPPSAKQAAIDAINQNFTRYTISDGTVELRAKIAEYLEHQNSQKFSVNEILVSNGCKQASFNLLSAIISEGDEVILPVPYYTSHIRQIEMLGGVAALVQARMEDDYCLTVPMLEKAVSPKTQAMLITSPQNPTGAVYKRESLKAVAEFVISHDLWLLTDDIYCGIVYPPAKFEPMLKIFPQLKGRLLIVSGLSKSFAMTGWRVGFAAAPESVIRQASNVQANTTSNVCSISQKAALGALTGNPEFFRTFITDFQAKRDYAHLFLTKVKGIKCNKPDGAFYLFPDVSSFLGKKHGAQSLETSDSLCHYLLSEHNVAVVPGEAFGASGHLRISFAVKRETLEIGLGRLKKGLESLK